MTKELENKTLITYYGACVLFGLAWGLNLPNILASSSVFNIILYVLLLPALVIATYCSPISRRLI